MSSKGGDGPFYNDRWNDNDRRISTNSKSYEVQGEIHLRIFIS